MSSVNIRRVVENIRSGTNIYTPIVEAVVNGIQAIEERKTESGVVNITVHRSDQPELDGGLPSVDSFTISDNGIGFTEKNRNAFDTLYTDNKLEQGGKGFGRFVCLKYFENLEVESVFETSASKQKRSFRMGRKTDIIINEKVSGATDGIIGTRVMLRNAKGRGFPDKKLKTIARTLVEKLLPYFIDDDYSCPKIIIAEESGSGKIVLNDFVSNQLSALIKELPLELNELTIGPEGDSKSFKVRVFKVYSPRNQRSKISLVADRREVTDTAIHNYVPEFIDEFFEENISDISEGDRNYIVKAYVFGAYLDSNVSLERGGFEFPKDDNLLQRISQTDIEREAAELAKTALGTAITSRQEKKKKQVQEYVEDIAPWHRTIAEDVDISSMPYNPTPEQIETTFQKEKFNQEVSIRKEIELILSAPNTEDLNDGISAILAKVTKTSRSDLVHYIALRKHVLSLFARSFELAGPGKYPSEGTVHDIIFPRRGDTEATDFSDHNLWIIDERLNFTNFVSSDKPMDGANSDRPDLLAFDNPVIFRGDNDASNPITVFEFKKPGRDNFANPSAKDDPIQQVIRYVNNIRKGKFVIPTGRPIQVTQNTPFYGYVMCEITEKVKEWLEFEKEFTAMPDGMGWFRWLGNNNLYMEVLSWDKVLRDAEMRNSIFFHKLGIQ